MTVTENLGALGSWEIQLRDETPDYILAQLGFFGHVAIADGAVDVAAVGAGLLTGSRYVGVLRAKDKDTGRKLSGSGMVFWLGDEDDKGDIIEAEISLTAATLSTAVHAILDPSNAVTVGTIYSVAGTYTGKHQFQTRREALGIICDAFNVEFRVNGNGTVDVGTAAQLYNTEAPDTLIVRKGAGTDMNLVALGGDYEVDESVYDYSTRVVLLGQTIGTGDTPDEVFATGAADAPSVPYVNLRGNPVKMSRTISESGTTSGSVAARAQLQLNRFNRVARSLKVTAEEFETEGNFVVGDNVWVYDPDTGIANVATEVTFRGEVLHPDVVRVSGITWPVVQGMTVAFRTQAGVWLDLTPFVTWETGGNEVTVGDLPKSLSNPGDNPVQVRLDAVRADASIPAAPTGLTLTTFSTLNAQGQTGAVIHASWSAPSLNTDGSVIQDLSHYVVEYRWTARAPQWQQANATDLTEIDLIVVPGLPYEVRVTAVDLAGNASAPTATGTITSAADAIAPNAPADPVVTSYLGQLRIEYAGTDSSGNPMASDTNRIDVHVGTTNSFTPTAATRVSSINPFAKGVAYATATYSATDNRWVRLIAVDHSGNPSASSAVVGGHTVQVADGDIAAMSVGKLTAGTMSADVVTSGRFTTALTGARREMNAVGFQAFDASNVLTINLDGVNNLLTGTLQTALTGRRIVIGGSGNTGLIRLIAPDGTTAQLRSQTVSGQEIATFGVPIAGKWEYWNGFSASSTETLTGYSKSLVLGFGGGDTTDGAFALFYLPDKTNTASARSRIIADKTSLQAWFDTNGSGSFTVNEYSPTAGSSTRFVITSTSIRNWIPTGGTFEVDEVNPANGGTWYRFKVSQDLLTFGPGDPIGLGLIEMIPGTNAGFLSSATIRFTSPRHPNGVNYYAALLNYAVNNDLSNSGLEVRNGNNSGFEYIKAAGFLVSSSEKGKEDIRTAKAGAMDRLRALRVVEFRRKGAPVGVTAPVETGVVAEEAAQHAPEIVRPGRSETGPMVDLSSTVFAAVAALQELDARLSLIEKGKAA